jgi:acetyltransferase-like isoleucine patch superfamily enzyme
MKRENLLVSALRGGWRGLNRSVLLCQLGNRLRFPGLDIDPSVNHSIQGRFEYGEDVVVAVGGNLIVPTGAALLLGHGCYIGRYVELGPLGTVAIGDRTSVQDRCILVGDVTLGRYCMLSLNVLMTSGRHYFARWPNLLIRDQDRLVSEDPVQSAEHSRPIVVGEDCWLGMNAAVMPGITIGRGCVIGANAVVTHDLPPYCVAVGVPARVVKHRLPFLPPARIEWRQPQHFPYFYSGFQLALDERERNEPLGGHVAPKRFALWLDWGSGAELRLRARTHGDGEIVLESNAERVRLADEWLECRFPVPQAGMPGWIAVSGGSASVVVSEAWVE